MISYDDALQKVLENTDVLEMEEKPFFQCIGQVSAEDVHADINLPQSDISGPDGYAVRSADIKGAGRLSPVTLKIIETVRAGCLPRKKVVPGTAARIMTGSVISDGADCVVRFEDTDEPPDKNGPNTTKPAEVKIYVTLGAGANIRGAGSNIREGFPVVPGGTLIGPTRISALASIGRATLKVVRRPVIAVIATGDELVSVGKPLSPGKSYNSNTAAIASLVAHYGGIPKIMGIARDRELSLFKKIREGAKIADGIITSGGVSKGDYDLVRLVLGKIGEVVFSRIKMGPGAAVAFGMISGSSTGRHSSIPVFGLAGPPPGCLVNFETLVRPFLLKMRGIAALNHPVVEAIAMDSVPGRMPMAFVRFTYLRKRERKYHVTLNGVEKIGALASMATANSLTIVPEGSTIEAGDRVAVLPLDWSMGEI
ncbi:MAG: Molybdopterin molybdenumtransferase [Syntrophorhabdus sp. PtaU1.Bin153]|nr:MAG: Molybdopterin molybdenumtransferase [Syntrophorhabdus sp. PtaU1.Bin153]